jgi:hypothetical protein
MMNLLGSHFPTPIVLGRIWLVEKKLESHGNIKKPDLGVSDGVRELVEMQEWKRSAEDNDLLY